MAMLRREVRGVPDPRMTLPGRAEPVRIPERHVVLDTPLVPPYPTGIDTAVFGMGCFWGAEELFWQLAGVYTTAVGYAGGTTPNPTYEEVCTGRTGHTEVALVAFDAALVSFDALLGVFWEGHDPTQGMRQGNDVGTQYRSAILTTSARQLADAERSAQVYGPLLAAAGYGPITTQIAPLGEFYFAEEYHQQYLAKNPNGYRCHSASGVPYPGGAGISA